MSSMARSCSDSTAVVRKAGASGAGGFVLDRLSIRRRAGLTSAESSARAVGKFAPGVGESLDNRRSDVCQLARRLRLARLRVTSNAGPFAMLTEDQTPVIELLSAPATHGGEPVERIETHASIVFLAGAGAWKLKRAVRYDYLDFSTIERRKAMCEAEIELNRRTAPSLYRSAVPIVRRP